MAYVSARPEIDVSAGRRRRLSALHQRRREDHGRGVGTHAAVRHDLRRRGDRQRPRL